MKTKLAVAVVGVLPSLTALCQGTVVYDQQSYSGLPSNDQLAPITSGQPMGQSFTPSLSAVGFINLALHGGIDGKAGTVYIDILSGSITGPVLGTSEAVTVAPFAFGVVTFNFDNPVQLTPGITYYFQPVVESSGGNVTTPLISPSIYAGGTGFYNGTAVPNADLEFQEGVYVPEPSMWALLVLGACALWFVRRKT
jgi:hypothetical protein